MSSIIKELSAALKKKSDKLDELMLKFDSLTNDKSELENQVFWFSSRRMIVEERNVLRGIWVPETSIQRRNKLKQAEFAIEKTKNDLATLSQAIDLEQEQASTNLKNNLLALESQKTNVNLAQSVFDLSKKKYEAGTGSNTEINASDVDLKAAQTNYISALYDAIIARVDYLTAIGKL